MSIEDRVKKIVSDQLGTSLDEIQSDSSFVDDLGADSLDTVELVMALEEEFDLEIADEDAEKISPPSSSCNSIHFSISLVEEIIPPAAPILSQFAQAIGTLLPLTGLCGVATFFMPNNSSVEVSVRSIFNGVKIFSLR